MVVEGYINQAVEMAKKAGIHGPATTPFLLEKVKELSGGLTLKTNIALLENNACLASKISIALTPGIEKHLI